MRTLTAVIGLGIIGAAPAAIAESWRAKPMLERGAPATCQEADVSHVFFDLADMGNELSVRTNGGEAFSAPIGADGHVNTTVSVPVGKRNLSVNLTGNVKTREMEVFNKQYSCRFKLAPMP